MRRGRTGAAVIAASALVAWQAAPATAHALHGEVDSPLPLWVYLSGAAVVVGLSFAFAAISDDRPTADSPPGPVRQIWPPLRWLFRLAGLSAWAWVLLQAIAGGTSDAAVGGLLLWVFGWVGLALASALLGPVWGWLDPFSTLHDILAALIRPTGVGLAGRAPWHDRVDAWPAALGLGFFVWLELAARVEAPRALGIVLAGYTLVSLAGMAWYGKERWRTSGEVFSVWFGLLGRFAPYGAVGPPEAGSFRRRGFGAALARARWSSALLAVVAIGTGSVIWDGISQTELYFDLVGPRHFITQSLLLVAFLALVVGLVIAVGQRVGLEAMGAGLVPVTVGYLVAHYLTYLLTEGQRIVVALSDPLQQGWDLLGTAGFEPNQDLLPTSLVWTLQVGAVVLGHVAGAWLGHAAIRRRRAAGEVVSGWPLAALMVTLTVVALWSLGQNLVFSVEASA